MHLQKKEYEFVRAFYFSRENKIKIQHCIVWYCHCDIVIKKFLNIKKLEMLVLRLFLQEVVSKYVHERKKPTHSTNE